ncbi:MAG: hypothetical protein ACTSY1_07465 [Alphaproteobacteria bacterium]
MSLKNIRLELARTSKFPSGSKQHGYVFTAPIDESGRIDAVEWSQSCQSCLVIRFWAGEADKVGHVVHKAGGQWAFIYQSRGEERSVCFDEQIFALGKFITINGQGDEQRTFKVTRVDPFGLPE